MRYDDSYFWWLVRKAEKEIESKTDDEILKMDTSKIVEDYVQRLGLPLITRDESKSIINQAKEARYLHSDDDDGILELRRLQVVQVFYPVTLHEQLKQLFEDDRFRFIEFVGSVDYVDGIVSFSFAEEMKPAERRIGDVESVMESVNNNIESGIKSMRLQLTKFIEDFKKAINYERNHNKSESKSSHVESDSDGDYEDDHGRTPNDDRSDSLNPNNPAYDVSRDNRSDQLNPNNPRYQGE